MYSYRRICYLDEINPCDANPCLNGATCGPLTGLTYICTANVVLALTEQTEIRKYSLGLDRINPCDANLCLNEAKCAALIALTYTCQCDIGFNGPNCEISKYSLDLDKINPCNASLYLNGATCATLIGLSNKGAVNVILALT